MLFRTVKIVQALHATFAIPQACIINTKLVIVVGVVVLGGGALTMGVKF